MKFTTAILHIVVLNTIIHGVKATPVKGGRQLTTRNLKKKNSEKGKRKISKEPKAPKSKTKATTSSPTGSPTGNPTSAPTVATFISSTVVRNAASAAELESIQILQSLIDGQVLAEELGFYRAGAAEMYSPATNTHIRPYKGCRYEAFGLNGGNYTKLVCDSYEMNAKVCDLEPTCDAELFMKITYRAMKGEYLLNADDLLKLSCYESPLFRGALAQESLALELDLTCDNAPELPIAGLTNSNAAKEVVVSDIQQLQGAISMFVPGKFSNELISHGVYYTYNEYNVSQSIDIGDSQFTYMEAILGPKGFSTELAIKARAIGDYADYHVTSVEGPSFLFHSSVMESYFSQKYSCLAYNDNDRDVLFDFTQFRYGNRLCTRNIGTYLAVNYDNTTAAFERLQMLMTEGELGTCNLVNLGLGLTDCSCINDDVLLDAADIANTVLKTGASARNPDGCV